MKLFPLMKGIDIIETNLEGFDITVNRPNADSRTVRKGDIFISIKGNSYNGHNYIGEALKRGAAVTVIDDHGFSGDFPYIRVPDSRRAYAMLWNNFCGEPSRALKCVGVTGTNGKSSAVTMLTHILNFSGRRAESIGTLNSRLTTPDPPRLYPRLRELADKGCEYAVIEVSSHALALGKTHPIEFELGIFTNLTREHLDFHGNMRRYADAKALLFSSCRETLYNSDDKYASYVTRFAKRRQSFSFSRNGADYVCKNPYSDLEKSRFELLRLGELFRVEMPMAGRFSIYNAMAACSAARILGVDAEEIKGAMKVMPPVRGRLERVDISGRDYCAFIDYAHTPDALQKLLCTVKESMGKRGRLVCLFGCGGDRDKGKRAVMGKIATSIADFTVITSDNPRSEDPFKIIGDILKGVDPAASYIVIPERRGAIRYAVHTAKKDDVILFCGKGHENYEINGWGRVPFDEKQIIKEADGERYEKGNEHYSR